MSSKDNNNKHPRSKEQILKEENLWKCDCSDEGKHISEMFHEGFCNYLLWLSLQDFDSLRGNDEQ